ncbi:hypothetical protein [Haloarcula amylovorans]|uniref:hypothetical protein n=1 Tax=Haloarcula amylovorans TaxID=2562280 RepID=UPI001075FF0B|nr:hypothetical protein [Halomicroarcula amylolytica]
MSSDALRKPPEIRRLAAERRKCLSDAFVTNYDKIVDGDKIRELTSAGRGGDSRTIESNVSKMYRSGPSTTGDVDMLRLEAEMVAEGRELSNPHIPLDEETLTEAVEKIERDGHTPAWEVVGDD